jgi:sugar phosphate isomerase/epimerase
MLHNYFPPPEEPFVFNLASENQEVLVRSMALAKAAIDKSSTCGAEHFAVHAGFLFDPAVSDLGNAISKSKLRPRDEGLEDFRRNILVLAKYAKEKKVKLLVENNVLSLANFLSFGCNPFLLASGQEIVDFFTNIESEVGFLLDVGHLSVSSNVLSEPREYFLEEFSDFISGYHLHENGRESDQHLEIDKNSWFLPLLNKDAPFATLEIHSQNFTEIKQSLEILRKAGVA